MIDSYMKTTNDKFFISDCKNIDEKIIECLKDLGFFILVFEFGCNINHQWECQIVKFNEDEIRLGEKNYFCVVCWD